MNLLISIDEEIYRHAQNRSEDSNDEWNAMRAIANGTPIPDNATVCDIEQIRDEMMDAYDDNRAHDMGDVAYGIKIALQIMMEHTKGE